MHPPNFETRTAEQRRLEQDFSRFSLAKVLRQLEKGEQIDGFEREVQTQFGASAGSGGQFGNTIVLPWGVLGGKRDLNVNTPSAGGSLVGFNIGPAADVLRPYSVTTRAGMTVLSGLKGDQGIPTVLEEPEFKWLGMESTFGANVTPTTGLVQLRPHTACAAITYSGRLLRGGNPAIVEQFVRRRLLSAAGQLIDRVTLQGRVSYLGQPDDTTAEPLGLVLTAGVQPFPTPLAGATLLTAGVLPAMTAVINKTGSDEGASFIAGPTARQYLAGTYWTDANNDGRLQGKAFHCTSAMSPLGIAYGDWGNAVTGLFGPGIELAIDPFTGFQSETITMRCMVTMDVAFPNPSAFAVAYSGTAPA